ncbi:MAG: lipoyltransferase [Proteobacteria bacterium]|nr:lipoyltransferase [Pseudomonadota bacterium]
MMRFDSNRAWNEAMAIVRANREVLPVLAGVFFLLPALVLALFFGDRQQAVMEAMSHLDDSAAMAAAQGQLVAMAPAALLASLIQLTGQMAVLAMLTDPRRPTVAEAIRAGLRALPVMIGAMVLALLFYLGATLLLGLALAVIASLAGGAMVAALGTLVLAVVIVVLVCRISLTMPVIVIEGQRNPLLALRRSWAITGGRVGSLLLFYVLLFLGYAVLAIAVSSVLGGAVALVAGKGATQTLVATLGAGVIAAGASVIFTALLVTIHRQLAD